MASKFALEPSVEMAYAMSGSIGTTFSASKGFVFTESMRLDFRADAFNVTNHTNFTGLVTDYNSANFGVFQSAAPNRTIQLGGRFTF